MLNASDIARMKADLELVIGDNEVSITIRRSGSELAAQTVRVERRKSQSIKKNAQGSEESTADIIVFGDENLNIRKDDHFSIDGSRYRVLFVRPNNMIGIQAEAELAA